MSFRETTMAGYLQNDEIINLKDFQIIYSGFNLVLQDSKRIGSFIGLVHAFHWLPCLTDDTFWQSQNRKHQSPGSYLKQSLNILGSVLHEHSEINQDKGKKNKN